MSDYVSERQTVSSMLSLAPKIGEFTSGLLYYVRRGQIEIYVFSWVGQKYFYITIMVTIADGNIETVAHELSAIIWYVWDIGLDW